MARSPGTLFGVGVGPGDPELVTLKALRILRAVPVVAWPAPESGPSLARRIAAPHLPGAQREIPIRMPLAPERFPAGDVYDRAAGEIAAALDAGEDVAAICEGDPFLYGSFVYLFGRLSETYRTEIVPGVSSLTACAAALGAPLAARNDSLAVIPGPLPETAMAERLAAADAAAFVKVGRHAGKIRAVLEKAGLAGSARSVEHATMPDQRILPLFEASEKGAPYFSMILVHRRGSAWL